MKIKFNGREIETRAETVGELLEELNINPETVVVSADGQIVPEQEELKEGMEVRTIRVVSGG